MKRSTFTYVLPGFLLAFGGCYDGNDGEGGGAGETDGVATEGDSTDDPSAGSGNDSDSEDPPENEDPGASCESSSVGPPLLRRLTGAEYERTVFAAFPQLEGVWEGSNMGPDPVSHHGFDNDADVLAVGNQVAAEIFDTAIDVSALITDPSRLPNLLPCAASSPDAACAETFVSTYGRRFFHRNLTEVELASYLDHYDSIAAESDFATAIRWTLVALMQSPHAVYRSEIGVDGDLEPWELATALAYSFSGGPPSDALLDRAAAGEFDDPAARVEEARALLASPGGAQVLDEFFRQWVGYAQVTTKQRNDAPEFDAVRGFMEEETQRFITKVVVEEGGDVTDLLTASYTLLNPELAAFYGFGGSPGGFEEVERPAEWGVGLLSQGSVLATYALADSSSPTQRGLLVYERLLCRETPPPPDNIPMIDPPTPGATTTRARYEEAHAGDPACAGCHVNFDPIGFAFEHFDNVGRYRADESGLAIDASGSASLGGELVEFSGATELSTSLADEARATDCASGLAAVYFYGGGGGTGCLAEEARGALRAGEVGLAEFVAQLAGTEHFAARREP